MAPIDIVVLAVIGIAFVAVCVRIYRKGTCADCAQGGVSRGIAPTKRRAPHLRRGQNRRRLGPWYQIGPRHPFAGRFAHLDASAAS